MDRDKLKAMLKHYEEWTCCDLCMFSVDCKTNRTDCSNYRYYRADKWEEGLKDLLINHVDEWDRTYASHYFKAVINEDYNNIIKSLEENNAK